MPTIFHPVQTHNPSKFAPEPVVLRAYEVYKALYGEQKALIDVEKGCRGGFSQNELIGFLYAYSFPREEWRKRFEEAVEQKR